MFDICVLYPMSMLYLCRKFVSNVKCFINLTKFIASLPANRKKIKCRVTGRCGCNFQEFFCNSLQSPEKTPMLFF